MITPKGLLKLVGLLSFPALFFLSFTQTGKSEGEQLAKQYCGSCHLMPNPRSLPGYIWQLRVLPVMAGYLGVAYMGNDPYRNLDSDEVTLLKQHHVFPEKPVIDSETWAKIVAYYVDNAPGKLPLDSARSQRNQPLDQFKTRLVPLGKTPGAMVTAVAYDTLRRELWVAEPNKMYRWTWSRGLTHNYDLPGTVVDVKFSPENRLLTDIGTLLPSELSTGNLFSFAADTLATRLTNLHRPVYSLAIDLNQDGVDELITAQYGHRSGALSLYAKPSKADAAYKETVLLNGPGAVKVYGRDMNGDGRTDLVALFAQNQESIYIFYQTGDLQFRAEKVLQFEPQYGTSDFVLLDYNKDGIEDIAVVHGDNADYSYCLKPFHGLRLLLGTEDHRYQEAFFYPLYGATRLQADDFDQDGDIDFAVSAFFPELTYLASESFVYLKNTDAARFRFTSYTLDTPTPAKSLTLEKADIDHDGDLDLILGQFSYSPVAVPPAMQQQWNQVPYKLMVLVNQKTP